MSSIECEICIHQYNEEEQTPRILTSCGHTICQKCATQLAQNERTITCPFDRKVTQLDKSGSEGVNGLQKNFSLLYLWRKEKQEEENDSGIKADFPCYENPSHEATFFCQICEVELCDSCFKSIHKSKALSAHQKIEISEKPIKLPKCPKHPHNIAEFLCTDPECKNPTKIMCHTCALFDQHKSHKYQFLMEQLLKNEQDLKDALERHKRHQREGKEYIEKLEKDMERFDESKAEFKNAAQKISDHFDSQKKEALNKLTLFVIDTKRKQAELKEKLEAEYSESEEVSKLIEKKLRMKNNLQNTDEITNVESGPWDVSLITAVNKQTELLGQQIWYEQQLTLPLRNSDSSLDAPFRISGQEEPRHLDKFKARVQQDLVGSNLSYPPSHIVLNSADAINRQTERYGPLLEWKQKNIQRQAEGKSQMRERNALRYRNYHGNTANSESDYLRQARLREADRAEYERKAEEEFQNQLEYQSQEKKEKVYKRETARLHEPIMEELRQRINFPFSRSK